ncbi:hypothetical protein ScPMuIL_016436 [Solemya velum]
MDISNCNAHSAEQSGSISGFHDSSSSLLSLRQRLASRRKTVIGVSVLCVCLLVVAIVVPVTLSNGDSSDTAPKTPKSQRAVNNLERAKDILKRIPLVDGHNDFPWRLQLNVEGRVSQLNMTSDLRRVFANNSEQHPSQTDIPGFGAASLALNQFKDAVKKGLQQVDVIKLFTRKYNDTFDFVTTADGISRTFQQGKIASLVGLEGGHMIDSSLSVLRMFYDLGVRYMTLTWSCQTPWADGKGESETGNNEHGGLTDWGKIVVKEMNRMGMMVDISHVSQMTMNTVFDISKAPVIYSHSSSFHLCKNFRNVRDLELERLKENGGLIMVNFYHQFVNCNSSRNATLSDIADHLDHIKNVTGANHIGIGADFDGVEVQTTGLEDVSKYPQLFAELLARNWSEEELEKLAFRNFYRVFKRVEEVRDNLTDVEPYDDVFDLSELPEENKKCLTIRWESPNGNTTVSPTNVTPSSTTMEPRSGGLPISSTVPPTKLTPSSATIEPRSGGLTIPSIVPPIDVTPSSATIEPRSVGLTIPTIVPPIDVTPSSATIEPRSGGLTRSSTVPSSSKDGTE